MEDSPSHSTASDRVHEDVHETIGWIVDVLELAVAVRGFVGVSSDRVTLVQGNEWQNFTLKIFPCCSMVDGRMDVENSDCCKWKICPRHAAVVKFEEWIVDGLWEHSAILVTLLNMNHNTLFVPSVSLDNGSCRQSRSDVLLGIIEHGSCSGCQAVRGRNIIFGVNAIFLGSEETSEHPECGSPILTLCGNVSCQKFHSGGRSAADKACNRSG